MREAEPARLAALNFGIQLVWGAVLAVSLQSRSIELTHGGSVQSYALLAATGAVLAAIVQLGAGRIADLRHAAIGHRREFYVAGIAGAIPMLYWLYCAGSFTQLACAFFGLQIAMNVAGGPYQAAIPDHAPAGRHGATSSWMSALQSLGAAAGLLVAGFLTNQFVIASILASGLLASFAVTFMHVRTLPISLAPAPAARATTPMIALLFSRGAINTGFYILLGFLLFFVRESLGVAGLAAQRTDTALLFLSFTLAAIPGAALAARPAERYDKRVVISIANACITLALIVLACAHDLGVAFAAAIIAGVAWGAFATADWALACALLPRDATASAMGVWNLASVVPQIAAPLLVAPLIIRADAYAPGFGPRAAMLAAAVAFVAGTCIIWRIPDTTKTTDRN